jgi:hypothetical protein
MPSDFDAPAVAAIMRLAVRQLKTTLEEAARTAVATFERQTGTTPSTLAIEMVDVSPAGDPPYYIVAGVRLGLDDL